MSELRDSIWIDPERMSGAPCFRGTRVPVKTLTDYLAAGYPLDYFLECFPSVTREVAVRYLQLAEEHAIAGVSEHAA